MYQPRADEPAYARLNDPESATRNRYDRPIETVPAGDPLRERSLNINDDAGIGANPNRYRQHGFFFTADNCIACHACEAACSEKNDLPPHLAFRSVGFVEGGTWPAYQRINISMACNHCDDPVCLKGCPTRAYTKFAEYGAVLQDPDICFGCGYCTWVCPYNAPQLDPVRGEVSKCNMCVDRLEAGLKPACVAACLGKALDFGVIENLPEGRTQARVEIPGFPRADITHPNIRFQQTRTTPREMLRVDATAVKYRKDDTSDSFRPVLDPKHGFRRAWNLQKLLGSHENAHVAFTLGTQAAMGGFVAWLGLGERMPGEGMSVLFVPLILLGLLSFGLFRLTLHLGKPHRFYRGFYNLRLSPVSREIAGVSLFFAGLAGQTLFLPFDGAVPSALRWMGVVLALAGVVGGGYYMYRLYRIPARPFWDHWHTAASFAGTAVSLGVLLLALAALVQGVLTDELARTFAVAIAIGLSLEGAGLMFQFRDLMRTGGEGAASLYEQRTTYGNPWRLRNGLLVVSLSIASAIAFAGAGAAMAFLPLAVTALVTAILGRALFYAVVIPTTMPGAFFWRNSGFVAHAREVGLADMPQLGVVRERHHPFRFDALWRTIRETPLREKLAQARRILTG